MASAGGAAARDGHRPGAVDPQADGAARPQDRRFRPDRAQRGVRLAGARLPAPAWASPTTPSTSIRTAARSRSAIRSACRARGLRSPRCTAWRSAAASARSPPCASASGRGFRSRSSGCEAYPAGANPIRPRFGRPSRRADECRLHPVSSQPVEAEVPAAGRARSMRTAMCSGRRRNFPIAPERKYTPCDAPKEKLFALRDFLGFDKNVIVQASCHSKDNRAMVDALEASNSKAKGVAFVGEEVTDDELKAHGPRRGARACASTSSSGWSISPRATCCERIAARVAPLGWHIVVYFEMPDLAELESFFTSLPTTRGGRSHGHCRTWQGRRRSGEPAVPPAAGQAQELLGQGHLSGTHDGRRPAL